MLPLLDFSAAIIFGPQKWNKRLHSGILCQIASLARIMQFCAKKGMPTPELLRWLCLLALLLSYLRSLGHVSKLTFLQFIHRGRESFYGAQNHNIFPCQELKMQKELLTNKRENNHDFSAHTYRIFMSSDSYIPSWYITIIAARLGMVYAIQLFPHRENLFEAGFTSRGIL